MRHLPNELTNIIYEYSHFLKILNFIEHIESKDDENWDIVYNENLLYKYFTNKIRGRSCYILANYGYNLEASLNICVNLQKKDKPYYFKLVYPTYMWGCNCDSEFLSYAEITNIIDNNSAEKIFKYIYDYNE